ncbi:cutinase family protein [Nocardia altamirensis]|uniref:cutinase family protein n=1 Tax=Nocardia altamirensis TaxID=472158 RepID=UPI001FE2157F|nr:cutinase family protein [Nocardia altamirensis]
MGKSIFSIVARVAGVVGLTLATAGVASAMPVAAKPAGAACTDVDVVVARGTAEPGILGVIVGDPIYVALQRAMTGRTTSAYRVNYPADLNEPVSVQAGNRDLVDHVVAQANACPHQRFVIVGYSQGTNVVANSVGVSSDGALVGGPIAATLPEWVEPKVSALLMFGPPIRAAGRGITGPYAGRTWEFCAAGDPVCQAWGINPFAHLSYIAHTPEAASFAADR